MKHLQTLCAFTLLSTPAVAFAQDAELRETAIVVTAPGPDRSAGELISHVTRLDRTDIVNDLAGTLGDTLDRQPGVATTYFGAGASRPVLRGLGAERVLVLTNGLGVIDASAASPDHQVAGDGIDAEVIEILRGPAALAYGGQAIGGVVNVIDGLIVDRPVDDGLSGDAFVAGNTVNEGSEGAAKLRFASGGFVANFSVSGRDFGDYDIPGFVESSELRAMEDEEAFERDMVENSFLKTNTFAGGLSWVSAGGYAGVAVRHTTSEYGLPGHAHGHEGHDHDEEDHDDHDHDDEDHDEHEEDHDEHDHEEESPFIDLEQTRIDLKAGINLNGNVWKKIDASLSYADYEHTEFEAAGEPGTRYESDGYEVRLEADHTFNGMVGAVGVQFSDKSFGAFGEEAFISPTDTQSLGVFIYETRDWDSGFGVEGGLRLDRVSYENELKGDVEFDLFSGSFGAHRHWPSGWFTGGQISLTERAPDQSELFADGPHLATSQYEVGDVSLRKERGLNFEATMRWENTASSFGVNAFYTDFHDFIYLTPGEVLQDGELTDEVDELPVWLFTQDDAGFTGFEIMAAHRFASTPVGAVWTASGNLDFVRAKFSEGGNVPYLPPMTFNGALEADWGVVRTELAMTWAAEQESSGTGILDTDGYTVFDIHAEARLADLIGAPEGLVAFVDVRNLTDEEVRYATSVLKDQLPAPGMNVRFGAKFSF